MGPVQNPEVQGKADASVCGAGFAFLVDEASYGQKTPLWSAGGDPPPLRHS